MRLALLALAFAFASSSACGSSEEDSDDSGRFDVSSYDKSCAASSDCLPVYSGDLCGCDCATTAIAAAEQLRYDADADAYRERACPDGGLICGPCPPGPMAACSDGQCVLEQ